MTFKHLFLVIGLALLPLVGHAQWQWVDNQGKKVFSDQPPPTDIPEKNIVRRPFGSRVPSPPAAAPAPDAAGESTEKAAQAPSPAAKPSGVDKELEAKARQAEEAEKAKRAAEEQRVAKLRAESCNRARQGKATIDSGMRVARVNASGEREVLDDQARAAEQRRIQAIIDSDCK